MKQPTELPSRPCLRDGPIYVFAAMKGEIFQQGDPIRCAACCIGRSGFGACVARCIATGQACDSGLRNCTSCERAWTH